MRRVGAVLGTVALLILPACSRSVEGAPIALPGSAAVSGTPSPSTPSAAPRPAPDKLRLLEAALLRPTEVAPTWHAAAEQPTPDASASAVCGGPGVVAQFPDAQRTASALEGAKGERLQETLSVYNDRDRAQAAFDAYAAGLACGEGKLSDTIVKVSPGADVTAGVGGDRATSWTIDSPTFSAVLVSVLAEAYVANFVFLTSTGVQSTRPDAVSLARTGTARLLAT